MLGTPDDTRDTARGTETCPVLDLASRLTLRRDPAAAAEIVEYNDRQGWEAAVKHFTTVPKSLEKLEKDKPGVKVRSWQLGCWLLQERGYGEVWNLEGGIDAWSREVDPAVPRY